MFSLSSRDTFKDSFIIIIKITIDGIQDLFLVLFYRAKIYKGWQMCLDESNLPRGGKKLFFIIA